MGLGGRSWDLMRNSMKKGLKSQAQSARHRNKKKKMSLRKENVGF
jgi:hypothetical protein